MDLRTEKTRRSVINAFLQLRAAKPLEKITVRELAEKAEINKATFYLHYRDIYDLSEKLERDVVRSCLQGISQPENVLRDTRRFIKDLEDSFISNEQLIKILFEGNRSSSFVSLFEEEITALIRSAYPDYKPDTEQRMMLTYLVSGGYYTFFKYCDRGIKPVLELIEKLSDGIVDLYEN